MLEKLSCFHGHDAKKQTQVTYDPGPKPFSLKLGALNPRIEFRLEGPKSKPMEHLSTKFVKRFVLSPVGRYEVLRLRRSIR